MRRYVLLGFVMVAVGAAGCSSGGSTPTGPGNPPVPPADTITINVVGINGAQSFSPNPAAVAAGRLVVWHNVDTVTHHVVLDDGRLDTGNIAPGAFSQAMMLPAPGPYHCTIHPSMTGTIAQAR